MKKNIHFFPNNVYLKNFKENILVNQRTINKVYSYTGKFNIDDVIFLRYNLFDFFRLVKDFFVCNEIYLHGYFSIEIAFLFLLFPKLNQKCSWLVWGGDIYENKNKFFESFRKKTIKKFKRILTPTKGDYILVQRLYETHSINLFYTYPNPIEIKKYENSQKVNTEGQYTILFGNAAHKELDHIRWLNELKFINDNRIKLVVPLSYGDMNYAEKVKEYILSNLSRRTVILEEFQTQDIYLKTLKNIDIAVFPAERQIALGNIYTLLLMGKVIAINDLSSTVDHLSIINIQFLTLNQIRNLGVDELIEAIKKVDIDRNIQIMKETYYNNEYLQNLWQNILN